MTQVLCRLTKKKNQVDNICGMSTNNLLVKLQWQNNQLLISHLRESRPHRPVHVCKILTQFPASANIIKWVCNKFSMAFLKQLGKNIKKNPFYFGLYALWFCYFKNVQLVLKLFDICRSLQMGNKCLYFDEKSLRDPL